MNPKTLKRGGIAVILVGLALLVFPILTNYQTEHEQKALEKEWNSLNHSYQNPFQVPRVKAANPVSKKDSTISTDKNTEDKKDKAIEEGVIGKITIPKIDLTAMMVPGVTQKDMKNAIGWMTSTSYPGEKGNSVLAGHRSHTYGRFFHRLNEVEKGDTIKIQTTEGTMLYRVYEKYVVKPNNLSVIKAKKSEEITLITCEPLYSDKYRLIVRAERIQ